jgi:hypothetical protein
VIKLSLNSTLVKSHALFEFEVNLFELSHAFTPYSQFFKINEIKDIYSGDEDIPFESKDPEFQNILRKEFL